MAAEVQARAPLTPVTHRVVGRRDETADVVTLLLEATDGSRLRYSAGQFNMLYAYAVGEVAISISANPVDDGPIAHTVRNVGTVSRALCGLHPGDSLGLRGPFGSDWGLDSAAGGDLVIVAGGIGLAPLRSVITQVISQRQRFGDVEIVIGTRTPEELAFKDEVSAWRERDDLSVHVTVDRATPGWRGTVGVVTTVLPRIHCDPAGVALICGPEVMMRFTALALLERGMQAAKIRVSMERNMQCAVAQCGHCQLGSVFVCADGPVLTWERVEPLLSVRQL
ncbi:MAG TPA: FAD/NAD(P)-binding protein [Candidatus Saccharimonadales bacterium]|nr:FAD/NAD(P)-binding protein [Candidatus Saccharimonadales bacterium]